MKTIHFAIIEDREDDSDVLAEKIRRICSELKCLPRVSALIGPNSSEIARQITRRFPRGTVDSVSRFDITSVDVMFQNEVNGGELLIKDLYETGVTDYLGTIAVRSNKEVVSLPTGVKCIRIPKNTLQEEDVWRSIISRVLATL